MKRENVIMGNLKDNQTNLSVNDKGKGLIHNNLTKTPLPNSGINQQLDSSPSQSDFIKPMKKKKWLWPTWKRWPKTR